MKIPNQNIKFPPKEISSPTGLEKRDFEYIILWMLNYNVVCNWSCFLDDPLSISVATLSKYMNQLISEGLAEKKSKGKYSITPDGRKQFTNKRLKDSFERKLRYPPPVILNKRNYKHIILWMLYNNDYCLRANFLDKPLQINHHSLTKTLNSLVEEKLVENINTKFQITDEGIVNYTRMLKKYQLDTQTILLEEIEKLEILKVNVAKNLSNYEIFDSTTQLLLLDWVCHIEYSSIASIIPSEENYYKLMLFLSLNHPHSYPNHISLSDFSVKYESEPTTISYFLQNIANTELYKFNFFKIELEADHVVYFRKNGKFDNKLQMIVEEKIENYSYLNKMTPDLSEENIKIQSAELLQIIASEICHNFFKKTRKSKLYDFLKQYLQTMLNLISKKGLQDPLLENFKKSAMKHMIDLNLEEMVELEKKKYKLTALLRDFPKFSIVDDLKKKFD